MQNAIYKLKVNKKLLKPIYNSFRLIKNHFQALILRKNNKSRKTRSIFSFVIKSHIMVVIRSYSEGKKTKKTRR